MRRIIIKNRRGFYLPVIMMASVLFIALASSIIAIALSNVKIARLHEKKITSMEIAEAGVNYYMWHLSHSNTDYCDGATCTGNAPYGPFTHDYTDKSGRSIGTYALYIIPPTGDSAITTVKSVGKVNGISPTRTIVATIGMPSFTKYALMVKDSQLWVGAGEKINGAVHVNGSGLYNQGEITGDATSTELTYNGWFGNQSGVAGPGVFGGAKLFPVPTVDFNQVSVDIINIRNNAVAGSGDYYNTATGYKGYHIKLNQNNYELSRVITYDGNGSNPGLDLITETTAEIHNYPSDGVIFCEDNVWLEGVVNQQKVTIIASDPEANSSKYKRIVLVNPVKYSNYDGKDKIGLITQSDILVSKNAPTNMEIDAAMLAKDGVIKVGDYGQHKGNMKVYGSMTHKAGLSWTYQGSNGYWSGYATTETDIDPHNVLNPPPSFPLTGSFNILSWREE